MTGLDNLLLFGQLLKLWLYILGQISRRFLKEEKSFIIPVKTALAILGHFFIDIGRLLLNPSGHMFTYMVHIILLKI